MSYQIPQRIRKVLMGEFGRLSEVIDSAVEQSFRTADIQCRGNAGEVDKVLSFFIEGLEVIENEFNWVLKERGVQVTIAGIFTHQTPIVSLGSDPDKRCELADLCILTSYGQELGVYRPGLGNGVFLQAKNHVDRYPGSPQRLLYEAEKEFEYQRPRSIACLSPQPPVRELPPKGEPALAYWELNGLAPVLRRRVTGLVWANQTNRRFLQRHGFGVALMDVFRGAAGYGFRRPGMNSRAWSRIIFDLVRVTARATVNRRRLNVRGAPRGSGNLARSLLTSGPGNRAYVVRNSLREILEFYSEEFAEFGAGLEQPAGDPGWEKELEMSGGDGGSDDGGKPPILGDERRVDDEDSGAGNLIFVRFSEQKQAGEK